jgi:hypothetical protein
MRSVALWRRTNLPTPPGLPRHLLLHRLFLLLLLLFLLRHLLLLLFFALTLTLTLVLTRYSRSLSLSVSLSLSFSLFTLTATFARTGAFTPTPRFPRRPPKLTGPFGEVVCSLVARRRSRICLPRERAGEPHPPTPGFLQGAPTDAARANFQCFLGSNGTAATGVPKLGHRMRQQGQGPPQSRVNNHTK